MFNVHERRKQIFRRIQDQLAELRKRIEAVQALHVPAEFQRGVPTFDEFDSPWQTGTECRECKNGTYPCDTIKALNGGA